MSERVAQGEESSPTTAVPAGRTAAGLDFLARAARTWTALPPDADADLVLGEQVRELVGESLVLVASADRPERAFRWSALVGDPAPLEEISLQLEGAAATWPLPDAVRALVMRPGLHDIPGGLRSLLAGQIGAEAAQRLSITLGLRRVRGLGLRWQGDVRTLVAVLERDAPLVADREPAPLLLEALANLATVALEQRRAAQAARVADRRYQELLDLLPGALLECDLTGRLTFVNRQTLAMTGYSEEDVRAGLTVANFLVPEDRQRAVAAVRGVLAGTPGYGHEYRAMRKDGTRYDLAVYSTPIYTGGRVTGMRGIGIDITRSTRAQAAQEESERRFRELVDLLPVGVVETDRSWRVTFANAHLSRMTGYTQDDVRDGLYLYDMVIEADRARSLLPTFTAGEVRQGLEYTCRHKDGSTSDLAIYASPMVRDGVIMGIRGIAIDVTARKRAAEEQRRLEARAQQAQKLESLGVLTRGIAHDFNNLLIAVLGNAELALRSLQGGTPAFERVAKVRKVAQRAAELVNQLLTYSGGGVGRRSRVDLNEVAAEVEALVRETVAPAATLRLELVPGLPPIEADAVQIRQLAVNLVLNAAEAITTPPGRVEVRTGVVAADRDLLARANCGDGVAPGAYVSLEVSDDGCGMDDATAHRIFDPFFTTKFAGRGLGLATVLGIVRAHGGAITVTTAPGRGTTVTVLLPPAGSAAT